MRDASMEGMPGLGTMLGERAAGLVRAAESAAGVVLVVTVVLAVLAMSSERAPGAAGFVVTSRV